MSVPLVQQPWTDAAIRDTVAAIASAPAYRRDVTTTLWDRFWRFVWETLVDLYRAVSGDTEIGRIVTGILLTALVVLGLVRFVISYREAHDPRLRARRERARGGSDGIAEAERLAAAGDYTAAAHALYAGLVGALASRGLVRRHASKTSGDYARELRRRGVPEHRAFEPFRRRYDRVLYRELVCTADEYAALLTDARRALAAGATTSTGRAA